MVPDKIELRAPHFKVVGSRPIPVAVGHYPFLELETVGQFHSRRIASPFSLSKNAFNPSGLKALYAEESPSGRRKD